MLLCQEDDDDTLWISSCFTNKLYSPRNTLRSFHGVWIHFYNNRNIRLTGRCGRVRRVRDHVCLAICCCSSWAHAPKILSKALLLLCDLRERGEGTKF